MPTFQLQVKNGPDGEIATISVDAVSPDQAFLNAEAQGYRVISTDAAEIPAGGPASRTSARTPARPPRAARTARTAPGPSAGNTVELGPETLKKLRSIIGWQILIALLIFSVLAPLLAVVAVGILNAMLPPG